VEEGELILAGAYQGPRLLCQQRSNGNFQRKKRNLPQQKKKPDGEQEGAGQGRF